MQKELLNIRELSNGTMLTAPIFRFKGSADAPSVYIQSSMHGAEVQGNALIYLLIEYLKENPPLGDITIVPTINPYGMNLKLGEYSFGRFEPTSGRNYNRYYFIPTEDDEKDIKAFASEYKESDLDIISNEFKKLLKNKIQNKLNEFSANGEFVQILNHKAHLIACEHDIVLDFHTASHSARHIYSQENKFEVAKSFGISNIILSPVVKTGDLEGAAVYPWSILAKELGHSEIECESHTLEFGSQERFNLDDAKEDFRGVLNYLALKGAVEAEHTQYKKEFHSCLFDNYLSIYSPVGGLVHFHQKPGQKVSAGEIYASIINFHKDEMKREFEAKQDFVIVNQMDSGIAHEGCELMRVILQ